MTKISEYVELCHVGDVSPDLPLKTQMDGIDVAVFQIGQAYYATQNLCTHGPGSLCEGYVSSDEVECPFHQGKFNIITGEPTAAPCTEALKTWKVIVRDGKILAARSSAGGEA